MSWTAADMWPSAMRHAYAWGVRQQFNRPHLLELLERIPRTRFLEPDHLARLNMPVYLIWGRGDDVLPPSQFEFYRAHLPPHASIDTPPHFGHAPFLHHTDDLADRLIGFLRRLHD
jgi:pimeloyl-ACP methyl ester carboxylesterase